MGGARRKRLTRRQLLGRSAALAAAAWAGPLVGPVAREARARTRGTVHDPSGTTLERSLTTIGDGPYFGLAPAPGWPIRVREELASASAGRGDRRRALAAVVHYTDFQLVDAQSPARVEFLDATADPPSPIPFGAAQRPQEPLITQVVEALVRRTRTVGSGPVTGRRPDCVVCTGDNLDNTQRNEMDWFRSLMDGGRLTPNSGAPDVYEGVQGFDATAFYDPDYYHPNPVDDPRAPDRYRAAHGFPGFPGLLEAAVAPFEATGVDTPWFSCYGNHDHLVQGNLQRNPAFERIATGSTKILGAPADHSPAELVEGLERQDPTVLADVSLAPARPVTPDADRHLMTPSEYVRAHLDGPADPGPRGHGFTEDNLDPLHLYYTFEVAEGIRGITLDTTSPASAAGVMPDSQLRWLEQRLVGVHGRYHDRSGREVTTGNDDRLVIVFSHHRPAGIQPVPTVVNKRGQPERGHGGEAVVSLLQRFPNVLLWVNGHSHFNRIVAHPHGEDPRRGFWDLTTAAQIDPPQQARILEVTDNRDGTLSIFTTVLDHAGRTDTSAGRYDVPGLAGIGRELAYNDLQADPAGAIGAPGDRNTELLIARPFDPAGGAPARSDDRGARDAADTRGAAGGDPAADAPVLPATGGGLAATALGAGVVGALALRQRDRRGRDAP